MGAVAGTDVRIKYYATGFGVSGVEIARAKADEISISNEYGDASDKDNAPWTTAEIGAKVKSASMTCSGILTDAQQTLIGLTVTEGADFPHFEIVLGDVGHFRGQWQIGGLKLGGSYGAENATYEWSLTSTGPVTWTAT